ncbi:putative phosphoribosylaminoimidazole carboxylase [Rosa chinensis]|uniref:Putative phosphoribosylaminoimidazole carboxylase n=1 Tax=Rosa chinensis TaxID=74649 RepID=A0A2P6PB79_ROSCH|nr:putative phosphoribosylaminoimidazole carboxylase [Rosa chinensis]
MLQVSVLVFVLYNILAQFVYMNWYCMNDNSYSSFTAAIGLIGGVKDHEDYRRSLYGEITHKTLLVNAIGTLIFPSQPMVQIDDLEGAKRAGDLFDYRLMIKSKRLAYDGRGNDVAKSKHDLSSIVTVEPIALLLLSKFVAALGGFDRGLYVEKWAPFVKLAVIVARGRDNSIVCYPVVETIHK